MRILPIQFTKITGVTDEDYRKYCQKNHKNLTSREVRDEFMRQKYDSLLEKRKKGEKKDDLQN